MNAELKPCPWCKKIDLLVCEPTDHGKVKRPYGYRTSARVLNKTIDLPDGEAENDAEIC